MRAGGRGASVTRLREFIDAGEPRRLAQQDALYLIRELLAGKHENTVKAAAERVAAFRVTIRDADGEALLTLVRDEVAFGRLSAKRASKAMADMREVGELYEVTLPVFNITASRLQQLWRESSNPLRATVRVQRGRPKRKKAASTAPRAH